MFTDFPMDKKYQTEWRETSVAMMQKLNLLEEVSFERYKPR